MNKQYKLYILDKKYHMDTLNELYEKYEDESIIIIDENKVAIEYDYSKNSYRKLIESMNNFKATQNIITTSKFVKLLKYCVKSNISISDISLSEMLKEENEKINKCIRKINYGSEKDKFIQELLDEIEWLSYEEGIDIWSMSYKIKCKNKPIYIKFTLFNNGVVTIDNESIIEDVVKIIKCI